MSETKAADDLIDNWWRYYRDTRTKRRTLSLEGSYIPERQDIDYEEEPPPPPSKPVNRVEAVQVEKIVISLPLQYKLPLAIETFYRFVLFSNSSFYKTCRKNNLNPRNWESDVRKAKLMVLNRMERLYG